MSSCGPAFSHILPLEPQAQALFHDTRHASLSGRSHLRQRHSPLPSPPHLGSHQVIYSTPNTTPRRRSRPAARRITETLGLHECCCSLHFRGTAPLRIPVAPLPACDITRLRSFARHHEQPQHATEWHATKPGRCGTPSLYPALSCPAAAG